MRNNFTKVVVCLVLCCLTTLANASLILGSNFTADATEDFESFAGDRSFINSLFNGDVNIINESVNLASVTEGDWTDFRTSDNIIANSGDQFGTQFGFGFFTLDFNGLGGISGFSFYASAAGVGDDVLSFFDLSGNLIDTYTEVGGFGANGVMEFFTVTSTITIGSIRLQGSETAFDDISILNAPVENVPEPSVLALFALGLISMTIRLKRKLK